MATYCPDTYSSSHSSPSGPQHSITGSVPISKTLRSPITNTLDIGMDASLATVSPEAEAQELLFGSLDPHSTFSNTPFDVSEFNFDLGDMSSWCILSPTHSSSSSQTSSGTAGGQDSPISALALSTPATTTTTLVPSTFEEEEDIDQLIEDDAEDLSTLRLFTFSPKPVDTSMGTSTATPASSARRQKLPEEEALRRQRERNREGARRWRQKQKDEIEQLKEQAVKMDQRIRQRDFVLKKLQRTAMAQEEHIKYLREKLRQHAASYPILSPAQQALAAGSRFQSLQQMTSSPGTMSDAGASFFPLSAYSGFGALSSY